MDILKAENFGIVPESEISQKLAEMLKFAKDNNCREIKFQTGVYYIDAEKCNRYILHITNTVGDSEFSENETPHLNAVAFYMKDFENITVDGNDAIFVIDGKTTNVVLSNCKNVTLKNIEIRHKSPDMHRLTVKSKTPFSVDFTSDKQTNIEFDGKIPHFVGKDYNYPVNKNARVARWIPRMRAGDGDYVERVKHPLCSALGFSKTQDGFRAYYPNTRKFRLKDSFYIYDVRRQFAGIFVEKCENIKLENIKQRFNYSLAVVMQCSENVKIENSVFAPLASSDLALASCADFVQANMCRGDISVVGCEFCGAGDDCANFHGVHFKTIHSDENSLTVRFMHPQTHGFDPFCTGDEIAFIDPKTLRETGRAKVKRTDLMNEKDIKLELVNKYKAKTGSAVENITACPNVEFRNNRVSRIVTRGVLVTTRGKVTLSDNRFVSTAMSNVLISDDAENWYESGCCKDVTIENNDFLRYGEPAIMIKPENSVYDGAVHENVKIIGNRFHSGQTLWASSTKNLQFKNNFTETKISVKLKNCENAEIQ